MPPDAALASDLSLGGIRIKVWPVRSTLPPNYTGCEWELVEATGPGAPADSMNRIGVTVSRDGKPVARLSLVYGLLALRDGFPPLCRYDNGRPVAGSADECRITGWKPEPR